MKLTEHLPEFRRSHVEARLHGNLMVWLTTVRHDGQPVCVPVWFLLREDETILVYSQPDKLKLANIERNPRVTLGLDVTDLGRDVIRVHGIAERADQITPAHENEQYIVKYAERIGALFGTADGFSARFSVPLVITPTRLWA